MTWVWGYPGAGGPLSLRLCSRLIRHTKGLMESEEKLCVKVLRTLQQMLQKKSKFGDRVSVDSTGPGVGEEGGLGTQDAAHQAPRLDLPGQPAAEDAVAELPPEPEVQLPGRAP